MAGDAPAVRASYRGVARKGRDQPQGQDRRDRRLRAKHRAGRDLFAMAVGDGASDRRRGDRKLDMDEAGSIAPGLAVFTLSLIQKSNETRDRKSTRLLQSIMRNSYAVFSLK